MVLGFLILRNNFELKIIKQVGLHNLTCFFKYKKVGCHCLTSHFFKKNESINHSLDAIYERSLQHATFHYHEVLPVLFQDQHDSRVLSLHQ